MKRTNTSIYFLLLSLIISFNSNAQNIDLKGSFNKNKAVKQEEVRKTREQLDYSDACSQNTYDGYYSFLTKYPTSKYSEEIRNKLEELVLWENAERANTIESFQKYIIESKSKEHKIQAEYAISLLKKVIEDSDWQALSFDSTIEDYDAFMKSYPASSYIEEAKSRKHIIAAMVSYNQGDLRIAYDEFNAADSLPSLFKEEYDKCKEFVDYHSLEDSITSLKLFLSRYPNGNYTNDVSNRLAICLAKVMTPYTSDIDKQTALNYAKDEQTQIIVNKTISECEFKLQRIIKQEKQEKKRVEVKANGGYFMLGLELIDLGFEKVNSRNSYSGGLHFQLGNYKSLVRVAVGGKIGLYFNQDNLENERSDSATFEMADQFADMQAMLKFSLFRGAKSSFYLAGLTGLNFLIDTENYNEPNQNSYFGVGFGRARRNFDWMLYCRTDSNPNSNSNDIFSPRIGLSLSWYIL